MAKEDSDFQIGQLTGLVTSLGETVDKLSNVVSSLEMRIRTNEGETQKLIVKMTSLGILAGALGSFMMSLMQKFIVIR